MSALELWTQVAIWLLIGGSIAVFFWFAHDLARLNRTFGQPPAARKAPGDAGWRDGGGEGREERTRSHPPPDQP